MTLVAHLIGAELGRFKWLLLGWLVIEATATTLSGIQPTFSARARLFELIGIVTNLLWLAEFLLFIVMIPLVVQADPLVGTDAFWMTRPIPPRALLSAKGIFLAVVVAVAPIVAESAVMIAYRVPLTDVSRVAVQNAVYQMLWLTIIMAAASVTPTLARYALLFAGAAIGLALLEAVTQLIQTSIGRHVPLLPAFPEPANPTASLMLLLLLTAAALGMIAVQYATRSWVRSAPVGVVAVILAIYASGHWRWEFFGGPPVVPQWAQEQSALQLFSIPGTVKAEPPSDYFGSKNALRSVRAQVRLGALPAGWSARAKLEGGKLQLLDGRRVTSWGIYATHVLMAGEAAPGSLLSETLLDVDRSLDSGPEEDEAIVVLSLLDHELTRLGQAHGRYDGRFRIELTHHEVEAIVPLKLGAVHQRGAFRIRIDAVRRDGLRSVSVLAHESAASSIFDREGQPARLYYLRNPQRREAILGRTNYQSTGTPIPRALPMAIHNDEQTGFSARAAELSFGSHRRQAESDPALDDGWLAGAELIIVRASDRGAVERTLAIDDFSIPAPTKSSSRLSMAQ